MEGASRDHTASSKKNKPAASLSPDTDTASSLTQHPSRGEVLTGPGYCPQRTAALHTELSEGQAQARLRLTRGAATAPTPTLYARFPSITSGPPRGAEPSGPHRVRCTAPAASTTAARCGPALRQAGPRKWAAPAAPGGPEGSGAPPGGRSRHPAAAGMVLVAARGARVTRRKAERNRHGDAAAARVSVAGGLAGCEAPCRGLGARGRARVPAGNGGPAAELGGRRWATWWGLGAAGCGRASCYVAKGDLVGFFSFPFFFPPDFSMRPPVRPLLESAAAQPAAVREKRKGARCCGPLPAWRGCVASQPPSDTAWRPGGREGERLRAPGQLPSLALLRAHLCVTHVQPACADVPVRHPLYSW